MDDRIELPGGRAVGYEDLGNPGDTAVIWCHGGPGSRMEPQPLAQIATAAGFRLVGIDRPGYGLSTPVPGRTIGAWVPDAVAVADHLKIERFMTVGVSTGGAYALALASLVPGRVLAAIACCALTDMRWAEGRAMMVGATTQGIWDAPDRETALAIAAEVFGDDGRKMFTQPGASSIAPADLKLMSDPEWLAGQARVWPPMFAQGVTGYADDRIADGEGWGTFDVSAIRCPTVVIHGGSDTIVPVAHARHTASLLDGAELRVFEDHGHLSIFGEIVPALVGLAGR